MEPFIKALAGALTAGALALGSSGSANAADPGDARSSLATGRAGTASVDWKPCPQDPTGECGTLRLPIDWAHPEGATYDMAVARRKATDPDRRIGVLLVNPGGPGDSGVDFALRRVPAQFSAGLQAKFDIVGFDPRGVGGSQPVKCSRELLDRRPSAYPRNQAEFDQLATYNEELRQDCRRRSGPVFDHADTLGVVRDMDALRVALGERKINYFGHSYGTLIGEQYAELFGDRIRSMALTANVDHSLGAREFLVSSARTAEDSFHQFVRWCGRSPSCALYGRNVTALWDALLARADRGELRDPGQPGQVLTAKDITLTAFKRFYGPDWSELAAYLAELDAQRPQRAQRLQRPVGAAAVTERQSAPGGKASATTGESSETTGESTAETTAEPFHAVFCQDWRIRPKDYREFARLTRAELRAAPHMRGSPRVHAAVAGCIGRPDQVNNPQHRLNITKAPKILLLHSRHDPANNHTWVTEVHRQTRRTTVLLTYEGAGHSVYGRSDCTRGAVDRYLTTLKAPADGSSCAAVDPG